MIVFDPNSLCLEAEPYYYDIIFGGGDEPVPEHITRHVDECPECQEQLSQLKAALLQADNVTAEENRANSTIAGMLRLHFSYVGKPVTCRIVKPFLPTLLDPVLQVNVPTPITAHLDECPQCSMDLMTIEQMDLNRRQLARLSRLFADNPGEDAARCSEARAAGLAAGLLVLRNASVETLKHLCTCPDCRKALYQYRQSVREDLLSAGGTEAEFPCESVSSGDIFDYCVPYGIDPDADQYCEFRESLASHLRSCPACLARMQELHNDVYGIAERPDSEVATTFHIDESAKARTTGNCDDLYAGFPIRVEVAGRKDGVSAEVSASAGGFAAALRQKVSTKGLKPLLKPAIAAAAIVLIAVALFLNTPAASGVTIKQIYETIGKVRNVYIASFGRNQTTPIQELWVSRALDIYMTKTEEEVVLWNIGSRLRKRKNLNIGTIDTVQLDDETLGGVERKMSGSLGLVPFHSISEIPDGAEWVHVKDASDSTAKDVEVYDLIWTSSKLGGSMASTRWRVFVNRKTNLPHRIEWYQKLTGDAEHTLSSVNVVEQLDESQMRAVLTKTAF